MSDSWEMWHWVTGSAAQAATVIALTIGGWWAVKRRKIFRELKHCIEFDLDADIVELQTPIETDKRYSWNPEGIREDSKKERLTHLVDVSLVFKNQGNTRFRLYNAWLHIYTMGATDGLRFSKKDGHFSLKRVFSSENIVPEMPNSDQQAKGTFFYYIEPGVTQKIRFLALIPEPRDVIRILAEFSLAGERLAAGTKYLPGGVWPHQAVKLFKLPGT